MRRIMLPAVCAASGLLLATEASAKETKGASGATGATGVTRVTGPPGATGAPGLAGTTRPRRAQGARRLGCTPMSDELEQELRGLAAGRGCELVVRPHGFRGWQAALRQSGTIVKAADKGTREGALRDLRDAIRLDDQRG
jgi:hypothetical protein